MIQIVLIRFAYFNFIDGIFRFILVRRICVIVGLLYGYRAVTMIVTVLPSANSEYHCDQQLNHTISSAEVLHRVVKIMSGFGLSINGHHVYCGDFIFSGHTMILVLAIFAAALGMFQFGYNTSVINQPQKYIEAFIKESYSKRGIEFTDGQITTLFR